MDRTPSNTGLGTPAPARRSAIRRLITWLLAAALLAAAGWWAWQQPFMAYPRALWELSRMPAPSRLAMPVAGVSVHQVADTWGAARGRDRRHEGVDIFAPRGTPVRSATRGVVVSVRDAGLGGRQVWVLGPGHERHYYAHMGDWAPGLKEGTVLAAGAALGVVGDTGNARGTPPHLHYGVYGAAGASDPLPRLRNGAAAGTRE